MLKELIKLSNDLDSRGLFKEADSIDRMIKTAWGFGWFEELEAGTVSEGEAGKAVDLESFRSGIEQDLQGHMEALNEVGSGRRRNNEIRNIREYYFDLYSKISGYWKGYENQEAALKIVQNTLAKLPSLEPTNTMSGDEKGVVDGSRLGEIIAEKSRLAKELSSVNADLKDIRYAIERIAGKHGYQAKIYIPGDSNSYTGSSSETGFIAFSGAIMNPEGLIQDLSQIGIAARQEADHAFKLIIDNPTVD